MRDAPAELSPKALATPGLAMLVNSSVPSAMVNVCFEHGLFDRWEETRGRG